MYAGAGLCTLTDTSNNNSGNKDHSLPYVIAAVAIVVPCLVILTAILFKYRRAERQKKREMLVPALLQITEVEVGRRLGGGNFGDVFLGTWQGQTHVALKRLKDPEQLRGFLSEAATILSLNHPNVVRFLGVYVAPLETPHSEIDRYIAMEFLPLGSVDRLVRDRWDQLQVADLLGIGMHAAAGMRYLESKKVAHCDLALRNLLAAAQPGGAETRFLVKVSDFGLSHIAATAGKGAENKKKNKKMKAVIDALTRSRGTKEAEEEDYDESREEGTRLLAGFDTQAEDGPVPVRWSAPEVLRGERGTLKSDSWSFGVYNAR